MSVDKLVDSTQLDADLTSVANAIRTKGGTSASLAFPAGFVSAIQAIPTGGGDVDYSKILQGTETVIDAPEATSIRGNALRGYATSATLNAPKVTTISGAAFYGATGFSVLVFPKLTTGPAQDAIRNCTSLTALDVLRGAFGVTSCSGCSALNTLIIRSTGTLATLSNINAFNSTPFASGGSGGTLYVPSALISSYQSATNWSTILGYTNNSIEAIEGSIYETQYADGTAIE